jgi:tRNA(fMet)-specific endonuclease VapC
VNYILDTNVISELVAARPYTKVIDWIQSVDPDHVFLSVIVVGELKKGIEKLPDSDRKAALYQWLHGDLLAQFETHFLTIDVETMLVWGKLIAQMESLGRSISAIDSLLAATALQWKYILVTRNTVHFAQTGISLLNPWE